MAEEFRKERERGGGGGRERIRESSEGFHRGSSKESPKRFRDLQRLLISQLTDIYQH